MDGLVISPTFSCGWARYITHTPFVISPTLAILDPSASAESKALSTGVTRARGLLTIKVFNVATNEVLWITERSSKGHPCGVPPASPAPPPAQLALMGEEQKKPPLLNLTATGGLSGSARQAGPTWPQAAPLRAPRPGQIGLRPQAGRRLSRVSVETALIAPSKI